MTPPPGPEDALRTLDEELARGRHLIAVAATLEALDEAETAVLGRRAPFSAVQRGLGGLEEEPRRRVGRRTNEVREALRAAVSDRRRALEEERDARALEDDRIDVTLPGRRLRPGSLHPLTVTMHRIVDIFTRMGYRVVEGPEIETEWYNFDALNIPPDHPARTEKDTIYLDVPGRTDLLLRTETSAMQIRTMERVAPPVFVISPGRVFRQETADPSHSPVFHQVEALAVDEGLSFADLKGTLEAFARSMYGPRVRVRFHPDFFPFVEPGAQLAISCFVCGGRGCRTCKGEGWIELLGCGMVHPNVLKNVGYDPERYTGFAFGMGIERVAMPLYGVPDLRLFYEGDIRFLRQFQGLG
ncbi:phenylalanine--tRNA ligase subunit alpha [soil metagenome]